MTDRAVTLTSKEKSKCEKVRTVILWKAQNNGNFLCVKEF
jgi:hypothetical protein